MKIPHCSHMEHFSSKLIEAYRRYEQGENLTTESNLFPAEEVVSIHRAITQHRLTCPICCEVAQSQATANFDRRLISQ